MYQLKFYVSSVDFIVAKCREVNRGGYGIIKDTVPTSVNKESGHWSLVTGKGKVVPVLFSLTEHDAMKAYRESGYTATRFLVPRH
jgi:hypothetical protein